MFGEFARIYPEAGSIPLEVVSSCVIIRLAGSNPFGVFLCCHSPGRRKSAVECGGPRDNMRMLFPDSSSMWCLSQTRSLKSCRAVMVCKLFNPWSLETVHLRPHLFHVIVWLLANMVVDIQKYGPVDEQFCAILPVAMSRGRNNHALSWAAAEEKTSIYPVMYLGGEVGNEGDVIGF